MQAQDMSQLDSSSPFAVSRQYPVCPLTHLVWFGTCEVVLVVTNLPANAGDIRDAGSIPGLGRSPGGGYGNPLQYFCLESLMNRGA